MKLKKAFSIAELVIIIGITGFLSMLVITIIKPDEKYIPYAYYNTYNTLNTAVYNISEDAFDLSQKDTENTYPTEDKIFPGTLSSENDTVSAKELCKKLALDPNASSKDEGYGYLNTTAYNCSNSFKTVSPTGGDEQFKPEKNNMAFRTTNSMRYFITPLQSVKIKDPTKSNTETTLKYFIVWVDLNGDRLPNTTLWKEKRPSEIVPFVVTTGGTVIPVGYPTIDKKYMTVHIQYPSTSLTSYSTYIANFADAQTAAFGNKEYPSNDLLSLSAAFQNKYKNSALEVKDYTPSITNVDDNCKLNNLIDSPICALHIDERKGMH